MATPPALDAALQQALHLRVGGRTEEAESVCLAVLSRDPRCVPAWRELAACAAATGHLKVAEHHLGRALQVDPTADVLHDLGVVQLRLQQDRQAHESLQRAAAMAPLRADILSDLGLALHRLGRSTEACECYRRALAIEPGSVVTRSNLAGALKDLGDFEAAVAQYEHASSLAPGDLGLLSNLLWASCHQDDLPAQALYARHRKLAGAFDALPQASFVPEPGPPGRVLRLGFVSADLRNHAVSFFLQPIWQALDRKRFSIHAYACSQITDATTTVLKQACDHWIDAFRLDDEGLAQRIRADGIDLLFDLSGHTAGNRLPVFARRAAPVQASWIGYPCTTGLAAMDYLLSDAIFAPPGAIDQAFSEKIVRLPAAGGFEPPAALPDVQPLPALKRGFLTFGSFHRPAKLTRRTLDAWSRLLQALPTARLLIAHCNDEAAAAALKATFAARGIGADRLTFRPRASMPEYLGMHHEVDLALDAFGFSGGTTTAHALLMGVPVLTVAGDTLPSRQSATILHHAGIDGFVANSVDEFVDLAVGWSGRLDELAALRLQLRSRLQSLPLLRDALAARAFESAALAMWERWLSGLAPAALTVSEHGQADTQRHLAATVTTP